MIHILIILVRWWMGLQACWGFDASQVLAAIADWVSLGPPATARHPASPPDDRHKIFLLGRVRWATAPSLPAPIGRGPTPGPLRYSSRPT